MDLTLLDGFILVVLAGGLIRGIQVGAVRQVASLLGLLIAFFAAVQLMGPVGTLVAQSLGLSTEVAPLVGFVVLFVGVQLVFLALSRLLEAVLDSLSLGVANSVVGGALGGFKAALLLSVLFLVGAQVTLPGPNTRDASVLYGPVATVLPTTWDTASRYVPVVKSVSEEFGQQVRERVPAPKTPDAPSGASRNVESQDL